MMTSESTMKRCQTGSSSKVLFRVVADTQEQARGRFGRPFHEPGRGIMSLLLHPTNGLMNASIYDHRSQCLCESH